MKPVSKNVYFDVLDDIVNKYNNTVHRTIKMKPIDVTSDSYAEYNEDSNVTKSKCKVSDHVKISKWKSIFARGYTRIHCSTWKVLHGQYWRHSKDVRSDQCLAWLQNGDLKRETENLIVTAHNQSIRTNLVQAKIDKSQGEVLK